MGWFYRTCVRCLFKMYYPGGTLGVCNSPTKLRGRPKKSLPGMQRGFEASKTQRWLYALPKPYQAFPEKQFPGGILFGSLKLTSCSPIFTKLNGLPEKRLLEMCGASRTQGWLWALPKPCQKFSQESFQGSTLF